jgi:polar amino acid transport system substrate-binding protein
VWDIGLIGTERQRAERIALSATYAEIEATHLVPPVTPIASLAEVDRPGVWIASTAQAAYDLCLRGTFVRRP